MCVLTENLIFTLIATISTILIGIVGLLKWRQHYWTKVGLPILDPALLLGDTADLFNRKASFEEQFLHIYNKIKSRNLPHAGVYLSIQPFYVPVDPEIIKHILQIDFQHFVNHGLYADEVNDPLTGNIFNLRDAKWKHMRIKLTPNFTSGKMKMMFQAVVDCTTGLKTVMDKYAEEKTVLDIKEVLSRFTTDIIGSVGFGIECNSLQDPETPFRKYGKNVFEAHTFWDMLKGFMSFTLPRTLLKKIKLKMTKPEVEEFFMKIAKETVEYREKNNIYRKDFMQLLLQLKNEGFVADNEETTNQKKEKKEIQGLTMNELAAQAFMFFIAGYETSSTTMTFALYELAQNLKIQEKLRDDVNIIMKKHDNQLTYEALKEMVYMDQVIYETLRKYPPLPILLRECTKDYTLPNTKIMIKKSVGVAISVLGLHMDPDYYPEPEKFDPERFSEENKKTRKPFTWLPFGEGPRICIGLRFGMMQTKVGLTALLRNYKFSLNERTKVPIIFDKTNFFTSAEGGVWLDVEKLSEL